MARSFGDATNLLITNIEQGQELADTLRRSDHPEGHANLVLMRGRSQIAQSACLKDSEMT